MQHWTLGPTWRPGVEATWSTQASVCHADSADLSLSLSSGQQCVHLINLQAADLEARGRALLQRESEACSQEVTSLSQGLAASEEDRLTLAGRREEQALREAYVVSKIHSVHNQ